MKVYVVTSGEYSDYHICKVFADKKKAEQYCAVHNSRKDMSYDSPYTIEKYTLADDNFETDKPVFLRVKVKCQRGMYDEGKWDYDSFRGIEVWFSTEDTSKEEDYTRGGFYSKEEIPCRDYTFSVPKGTSRKKIEKIADDYCAKLNAREAEI